MKGSASWPIPPYTLINCPFQHTILYLFKECHYDNQHQHHKDKSSPDFLIKSKCWISLYIKSQSMWYDVQETRRVSREEGRIEGEQLYLIKQIIKRIIKNSPVSQIVTDLMEPLDTIQPIYDLAIKQAPDFDAEKILAQLIPKTTESLSK